MHIAERKANWLNSQISAKSDMVFWEIAIERFFVFYCFCQNIDKVNEGNWQNVLIIINFCQYFTNIL